MEHSQLKIIYPCCPFVYDYIDITRTFDHQYKELTHDELLAELVEMMLGSQIMGSVAIDRDRKIEITQYITDISSEESRKLYKKVNFYHIKQTIPKDYQRLWICFHTTAYTMNCSAILDKEYSTSIAWSLIPVTGSVKPITPKSNTVIVKKKDPSTISLEPQNDMNPIFDSVNKVDRQQQQLYRMGRRGMINSENSIEKILARSDEISNQPRVIEHLIKPRPNPIPLTANTRHVAHQLRVEQQTGTINTRLRHLPHLLEQTKRLDLGIEGVGQHVANLNNEIVMDRQPTVIKKSVFDTIDQNIQIHSMRGVYRFSPQQTGQIFLEVPTQKTGDRVVSVKGPVPNKPFIAFITVLRQNECLTITLHHLDIV